MRIPKECILGTDNPGATISSPFMGLPENMLVPGSHQVSDLVAAINAAHYQNAEMAFSDIPNHSRIYLGSRLFMMVHVDEFGNAGVQTWEEYAIRHGSTVKALHTARQYPRHQAADPCHLSEECIMEIYFDAISQGVPFSWSVVRPKFGNRMAGDILFFWPSYLAVYGAAAMDKLGSCVDLSSYSCENPFEPKVIHVAMPWLSEQEFGGIHTIAVGAGRKRLLVVNGGPYDGGTKKPITFQFNDRVLPRTSPYIVLHWAMTELQNGKTIAIGNTTAAGKSEGSADERSLRTPSGLLWESNGWSASAMIIGESEESRKVISDDITAATVDHKGTPKGVELEPVHFYRTDLHTEKEPIPFIQQCANGEVEGRIYWYNTGFNPETRRFEPYRHEMLGTDKRGTNSRCSYHVNSISSGQFVNTEPDNPARIDYLIVSIPAPKKPEGWHMPTILRLSTTEFFVQCLHGARANKGNPALGAVGDGYWAFEGYAGKSGFSLDTEAEMLSRDLKFWQSLNEDTPCFMVFNGHSMGASQEYKYSGTFLLRYFLENWNEEFLGAPLIPIPGVFTGGVPDISSFLPSDMEIDKRTWDPRILDQNFLKRDALGFDFFAYLAMNKILGQTGASSDAKMLLYDLMREFTVKQRQFE